MPYAPMMATPARVGEVPRDWFLEFKWDGVRAIVEVVGDGVRVTTRNGNDATGRYPELAALAAEVPVGTVLDGEIVALDEASRPSFSRLQHRMHLSNPVSIAEAAQRVPVVLMLFDLLRIGEEELLDLPYDQRHERLAALRLGSGAWQTPPVQRGDPRAIAEAAEAMGMEGIVAKSPASTYRPGTRSREWLKIKLHGRQEFVVGGFLPGRSGEALGSLLVGYHDDTGLRWAGGVGSGLTQEAIRLLEGTLRQMTRDDSPFVDEVTRPGAVFVEPVLVVEVEFREWTPDGRLRHPVYKGVRGDKPAADVVREG